MSDFVAKPVRKETLVAALAAALDPAVRACANAEHGTSPDDAAPAFDQSERDRLAADIGADGFAELMDMFASETAARLALIGSGDLDAPALLREVHSLKGAAASSLAIALSRRAAAIESRLKLGETLHDADMVCLTEAFEAWRRAARAFHGTEEASA